MKLVIEISPEARKDTRTKEKFDYLCDDHLQKLIELVLQEQLSPLIKVRKALI